MGARNWIEQIFVVVRLGLQTLPGRKSAALAAALGIAGVVAVLVGVLSMAQGFIRTLEMSSRPGTVIVLRGGSDTEMMSLFGGEVSRIVGEYEQVARSSTGPLVSPELFVILDLPKKSTGTDANVPLRGVEPVAFEVHDELTFVRGRRFVRGRQEMVAGVGAAAEFAGLDLGARIRVGSDTWTVVGHFQAHGGVAESEVWTDAGVLQSLFQRGNSYQSIYVKLVSPGAFESFREALAADPRLSTKVMRLDEYYADQSRMVSDLIYRLGTLIAGLMALGAMFGAWNTMHTAVTARRREIATLRALGFGAVPVVVSVLMESLLLATIGGAAGAAVAYGCFDGLQSATLNWTSLSQVAFAFTVTPRLVGQGVIWALVIGFFGGLIPAWRATRLPVARALHGL